MQFGKPIKWDIPLLEGYSYRFIKNSSLKPSIHNGFFGLLNFELIALLFRAKKSIVVIPGWNYASYWIAIIASKIFGHKLAIRCESPLNQELKKSTVSLLIKKILLGNILFRLSNYLFYIGKQNYEFYKFYFVNDKKLIFIPYAVDNFRFQNAYNDLNKEKQLLRLSYGLHPKKKVILYVGKFIAKKRPLDLLLALNKLDYSKIQVVMVGDGELKNEMIDYLTNHNLKDLVFLPGFINQTEIVKYYVIADVFVMCSGKGETWGLSVNEAMNFKLKLLISNTVGCCVDLLVNNKTGWSFEEGNINHLAKCIQEAISDNKIDENLYSAIINKFSYQTGISNLMKIVNKIE